MAGMNDIIMANPMGAIGQAVQTAGAMDQLSRMRTQDQTMQQDRGMELQDRQSKLAQAGVEFAAKAGTALDQVQDPAQKAAMYKQLRSMAGIQGFNVDAFPSEYTPAAQQRLDLAKAQVMANRTGMPSQKAFAPQPMVDAQGNYTGMGVPVFDPNTGQASLRPLGGGQIMNPLDLAAGRSAIDVGEYGQKQAIKGRTEPGIAEGKERGKLAAQADLMPGIEGDKTAAKEAAKTQDDLNVAHRKHATAYNVYETGMGNLLTSMGATTTGPIAGRLPALTASAQIAEGSAAAMAPVLKQMFREAGEGTFTEGDQKLLMDMLPSRTDHPEAAKAKIKMIDDIVRAKLNIGPDATMPNQGAPRAPRPGTVEDGHRFKGGDPADPANWEAM